MANKHPYAVKPVPAFDFSVFDEGVQDMIRNYTAANFFVERVDTNEKIKFEHLGWRFVPFIVRYEFTRRRSLSRAGELEIIISRRLDPKFKESREWKESDNEKHVYLEKEFNQTVTFSSISTTKIVSYDAETAIFQFEQRTKLGATKVFNAPFWSKFELPRRRDRGVLEQFQNGFRTTLQKACFLSEIVKKDMINLAKDDEKRARQQLSSSDDEDQTSSEDEI